MSEAPTKFVMIPNRAVGDQRMRAHHFHVIGAILRARDSKTRISTIGYERIASIAGYSRSRVSTAISDLIEWGYIARISRGRTSLGRQRANGYTVLYDSPSTESTPVGPGGKCHDEIAVNAPCPTRPDADWDQQGWTNPVQQGWTDIKNPSHKKEQLYQDPSFHSSLRSECLARQDDSKKEEKTYTAEDRLHKLFVNDSSHDEIGSYYVSRLKDERRWKQMVTEFEKAINDGKSDSDLADCALALNEWYVDSNRKHINAVRRSTS